MSFELPRHWGAYRRAALGRKLAMAGFAAAPLLGVAGRSDLAFGALALAVACSFLPLPWPEFEDRLEEGVLRVRIGRDVPPVFWALAAATAYGALRLAMLAISLELAGTTSSEYFFESGPGRALFYLAVAAMPFLLRPREVVVTPRGLTISGRLGRRKIAFERVRRLARTDGPGPGNVEVHLDDGTFVTLPAGSLSRHAHELLERRLAENLALARAGRAQGAGEALLARGDRTFDAWKKSALGLGAAEAHYRAQGLPREALLAVLKDPARPAERRIGAALALGASGDPELAKELDAIDLAAPERRVRIALTRALSGELDERTLEDALAEEEASRAAFERR